MLREFKRLCGASGFRIRLRNNFQWLFLMQHYGIPTRLLDWSKNPLVALYFALAGRASLSRSEGKEAVDEFSEQCGAVYVLDPGHLNSSFGGPDAPIDVVADFKQWKHYVDAGPGAFDPIAIHAHFVDERMRSQFGAFTLHGYNTWRLDYYDHIRLKLHKILIPHALFPRLRRSARLLGMTEEFLLPDFLGLDKSGLARSIKTLEEARFKADLAKWRARMKALK